MYLRAKQYLLSSFRPDVIYPRLTGWHIVVIAISKH